MLSRLEQHLTWSDLRFGLGGDLGHGLLTRGLVASPR